MTDLTLGASLSEPMVDDDYPTISMQAIGDDLPWRIARYDLDWRTADGYTVTAYLSHYGEFAGRPAGLPWHVFCVGPGGTKLDTWVGTPEAAKGRVVAHIAACIEELLGDEVDHA